MDHQQGSRNLRRAILLLLFSGAFCIGILSPVPKAAADSVLTAEESVSITAIVPSAAPVTPPGASSGGGGGGGAGAGSSANPFAPPTDPALNDAVFRGTAYPGSIVTILRDGVVAAEVPASPDASFEVTLSKLKAGTYNFGIRAQDSDGKLSSLQVYTVAVTAGVTTVIKGIFLPPTLSADKTSAKRGEAITFFGSAPPDAEVAAVVHSSAEIVKKISADDDGRWVYKLDTLGLEDGTHQIKVRGSTASDISPFSQSLAFAVGTALPSQLPVKDVSAVDVNGDSRVNLTDFSVLAYWYRRASPPPAADENHDGKVDLTDLSILAYYWTG